MLHLAASHYGETEPQITYQTKQDVAYGAYATV